MGLMTGSLLEARVDHLAESRLEQKEGYGQETSSFQTPTDDQAGWSWTSRWRSLSYRRFSLRTSVLFHIIRTAARDLTAWTSLLRRAFGSLPLNTSMMF